MAGHGLGHRLGNKSSLWEENGLAMASQQGSNPVQSLWEKRHMAEVASERLKGTLEGLRL